jgi:hypothetical protein
MAFRNHKKIAREVLGVTPMTWWRWRHDPVIGPKLPKPDMTVNGKEYFGDQTVELIIKVLAEYGNVRHAERFPEQREATG